MQVALAIFPNDDGLNVLVWGKWKAGSMRVRRFGTRMGMISTLEGLRLISPHDAATLEQFAFEHSSPLFSATIDEQTLADHDFAPAY